MKFAAILLCASLVAWPVDGAKSRKAEQTASGAVDLLSVIQETEETDSSNQLSQATAEETTPVNDFKPEDVDSQIDQLTKDDSKLSFDSTSAVVQEQPDFDVQFDSLPQMKNDVQVDTQQKGDSLDALTGLAQVGEPKTEDQLQPVAAWSADTEDSFQKTPRGNDIPDDEVQALDHVASLPVQSDEGPGSLDSVMGADFAKADVALAEGQPELQVAATASQSPIDVSKDPIVSELKVHPKTKEDAPLKIKDEMHPKTQEAHKAVVTKGMAEKDAKELAEKDAKEINSYINAKHQDQLRQKLSDMAKTGGTARIHRAVRALQKMGYTGKTMNDWVVGANLQDSLSTAVRERGATPALDAKLMYLALKKGQRSELRKVVNTLFRYGGTERVQRAQRIFSAWTKYDMQSQQGSVNQQQVSLLDRGTLADLAAVKHELAKADAAEMMEYLKRHRMQGLRNFITQIRGDGGEQRVLAANHEVQQHVQAAALPPELQAHSPVQQSGDAQQNLNFDANRAQAPAAAHVPVQPTAYAQDRRGQTEPERDSVALARQVQQQAQRDAYILATYLKRHDNEGLKTSYREMRNHGGWQRVAEAEKLARTMTSEQLPPM